MKQIIDSLIEKIGVRRAAAVLAVLQIVTAGFFADYKSKADSKLTTTQAQALESVKRAIDQAAEIAMQDAELSAPTVKPQASCGK